MVNHVIGDMTTGMPIAAQKCRQIRQPLVDPGGLIGIDVEVNQVLELVGKDTLIEIGSGCIGASAVCPVVAVDMHDIFVILGAFAGREIAGDIGGRTAVVVRFIADVENQDPCFLAFVATRQRLAEYRRYGRIDRIVELI